MKITFYGAVGGVTGSRYLIEHKDKKILVDCGMFQEDEEINERNWEDFPVEPSSIDAVVLTHAHIDHTGYIPALVKKGFNGPVYSSQATYDLCKILLLDSGKLMEGFAKKRGNDSPLYTQKDAERALSFFKPIKYDQVISIGDVFDVTLISSGHILGASFVKVFDGQNTLTFSGDLGRPNQVLMKAPPHITATDYLVLESTYGDRLHETVDSMQALANAVNETVKKKGVLMIPAFAVGRSQVILYLLYQLQQKKIIPEIPIYLDSPMAIKVTDLFCKYKEQLRLPLDICLKAFDLAIGTNTPEQSKKIDRKKGPMIIIAGSGMATGGRILHHFKHFISDAKNTVLFVGYQAGGTMGHKLENGAQEVEIDDRMYQIHAHIKKIDMLSAHADYNEILEWLSHFKKQPKKVFLTHGEQKSAQALQKKIEEKFGWQVILPEYAQSFDLS